MPGRRYTVPRGRDGWPVRGDPAPGLSGPQAFWHRDAVDYRARVPELMGERSGAPLLLTPCSNVKPYPRSPQSAKIRGVLRRLGFWDPSGPGMYGSPSGLGWIYLSDLLGLVPYEVAHEYPACCYNYPPDLLEADRRAWEELISTIAAGLSSAEPEVIIAYLPRRYLLILGEAIESAGVNLRLETVPYHLFHGHKRLEEVLGRILN